MVLSRIVVVPFRVLGLGFRDTAALIFRVPNKNPVFGFRV